MTAINAFHPDYVKVHMPDLTKELNLKATQVANGIANGAKSRAAKDAAKLTMKERTEKMLMLTEFHVFSKAGTENTTKKKKVK